jgi:tetratricopeptide (TPR) repeat protein
MAQIPDTTGPSTSYSDPIYDRLETVAQRVTNRLKIILIGLIIFIVAAVFTHQAMKNNPTAASANQFLQAMTLKDEADSSRNPGERTSKLDEAHKALTKVVQDDKVQPYFRARAAIELGQINLNRSQLTDAASVIAQAKTFATQAQNRDLELAVGLSEAAIALQKGEHANAEKLYSQVERAAGTDFPDRQFAGAFGAAKALELQGNLDDAIAKLETLINRSDANAQLLITMAKNEYWNLKRRKESAPAAAPATPAAPTTGVTPAAETGITAPTSPATPSAPSAPVNPEGK